MKIPCYELTGKFILNPLIENRWIYIVWKTKHNPIIITDSECKAPVAQIIWQDYVDVEEDEEEDYTMNAVLGGDQYMV